MIIEYLNTNNRQKLMAGLKDVFSKRWSEVIVIVLCFAYIAAGILVSLHRFWQYEVFYYDFGIFDQAIWNVSRLNPPIIEHFVTGGRWIFADHFNPSIFLLSPLYWITAKSEALLIVQAVAVGLSGLILYRIGTIILKDTLLAFAVLISYLLFIGVQNALITDFHPVTVAMLPFILTIWAVVKKRKFLYVFLLLLTLGFKENLFLLGIGVGIWVFFYNKEWRRLGVLSIILSMLWGFLSIKIIIPYFAGGAYHYLPSAPESLLGKIAFLFNDPIKRRTLFYSFVSYGFLPIFYPPFWPLILQDFVVRFYSQNTYLRWDLGMHYSAQIAPILATSTIFSLASLKQIYGVKRILHYYGGLLVVVAIVLHQFILHGPLGLAYNKAFYRHTQDFRFLDDLIKQVPKDASVMTQNNLAVRFTHQKVWLLRSNYEDYGPDYIVIDMREGQNPNNFFGIGLSEASRIVESLKQNPDYSVVYKTERQFIFKQTNS